MVLFLIKSIVSQISCPREAKCQICLASVFVVLGAEKDP